MLSRTAMYLTIAAAVFGLAQTAAAQLGQRLQSARLTNVTSGFSGTNTGITSGALDAGTALGSQSSAPALGETPTIGPQTSGPALPVTPAPAIRSPEADDRLGIGQPRTALPPTGRPALTQPIQPALGPQNSGPVMAPPGTPPTIPPRIGRPALGNPGTGALGPQSSEPVLGRQPQAPAIQSNP